MFQWYANAGACYTFLSDYDSLDTAADLHSARWFTRGFTLRELIAPCEVEFYDVNWRRFGTRHSLKRDVARIMGIDIAVLESARNRHIKLILSGMTIAKKMSWATHRKTTKEEDVAYCLLGIFDINMPLIYGEGFNAFLRL